MRKLIAMLMLLVSLNAMASLEEFAAAPSASGEITATFTADQVASMLGKGNTCVNDGAKVLFHSKNVTKSQCRKWRALGLNVIKFNQLERSLARKIMGLKG